MFFDPVRLQKKLHIGAVVLTPFFFFFLSFKSRPYISSMHCLEHSSSSCVTPVLSPYLSFLIFKFPTVWHVLVASSRKGKETCSHISLETPLLLVVHRRSHLGIRVRCHHGYLLLILPSLSILTYLQDPMLPMSSTLVHGAIPLTLKNPSTL